MVADMIYGIKMVNGFWYYRALESISIALLCLPLLPFTHARSESINADSLNSNFIQLGRRSGGRPQRAVHPMRLPVNTVKHTTFSMPRTRNLPIVGWLLVQRTASRATETTTETADISPSRVARCPVFDQTVRFFVYLSGQKMTINRTISCLVFGRLWKLHEIWSVDSHQNYWNCCHQLPDF